MAHATTLPALPLAVLLATSVGGCVPTTDAPPYMRLIDQRSFASGAQPVQEARMLPKFPLVTIRFVSPQTDFVAPLDQAVDAAIARKPDAEFDVIIPLPPKAVPDDAMQRHAADVAHEIAERGVLPDRIHIGIAQDQGAPFRELRIFTR
jgi:hypothetical protein